MPEPKLYVLAGYDGSHAFATEVAAYASRPNVQVIRPVKGQSLQEALQKIKAPANIIVACHGDYDGYEGSFQWHKDSEEPERYKDMFSGIPQTGIGFINIGACKGGSFSTTDDIKSIPKGTLVFSDVGDQAYGWSSSASKAQETRNPNNLRDLYLETLDNIDPKKFAAMQSKEEYRKLPPIEVLASNFVIGGTPPQTFEMPNEINALSARALLGMLDEPAFKRAVQQVKTRFDGTMYGVQNTMASSDAMIDKIAARFHNGTMSVTYFSDINELRISYALAFAYLHESGVLAEKINRAKEPPTTWAHNYVKPDEGASISYSGTGEIRITKSDLRALQEKLQKIEPKIHINGELDYPTLRALDKVYKAYKVEAISNKGFINIKNIDFSDPTDAGHILFNASLQQEIQKKERSIGYKQESLETLPHLQALQKLSATMQEMQANETFSPLITRNPASPPIERS